MQGKQIFQPKLFYQVSWQQMIPKDHLLRRIDTILDLSFVRDLTAELYCTDNGRPSIDPEVFFRIQLIGYLYGISSERQLCEEVSMHLGYRWFCRFSMEDEVPDHSSLTRIRDRLGEKVFREVFERVLSQCREKGLLRGEKILADGTLVEANSAIRAMVEREAEDPKKKDLPPPDKNYHDFREGKKRRKVSNQTHVHPKDPSATLVARPGCYGKLFFKVHQCADASSRVITDVAVTAGADHESQSLISRLEYQKNHLQLPIEEVTADRGYGTGKIYQYLSEQKIRSYIPTFDDRIGTGPIEQGFKYDRKNDRYICPEGNLLYPYEKKGARDYSRYRIMHGECRACPKRFGCLGTRPRQPTFTRPILRHPQQDLLDAVRRRMTTAYFKSRLRERMWKIESLFGEAKTNHLLRRAKYRGIQNMTIQALMTGITLNLKKLAKLLLDPFSIPDFQIAFAN